MSPKNFLLILTFLWHLIAATEEDEKIVVESLTDASQNVYLSVLEPPQLHFIYKLNPSKIGIPFNTTFHHIPLVATQPEHGCSSLTNARSLAGKVVLIVRGGCSFVTKAIHAQVSGAAALIVYDYSMEGVRLLSMIQDETPRQVHLPCAFMSGRDGHAIVTTLDKLGLPHALITFPVNMTGVPIHQQKLTPWSLW